ncbi:hypothetical protein FOA52_006424 [Chlamydomonas sp. UWO 241]|nr:hypothetical protein FOA52_006424 [Chlamydomonas sp. UWO 241]
MQRTPRSPPARPLAGATGLLSPAASLIEDGGDAGEQEPELSLDIDWSSVEEVSAHVSRTTLAGMQALWKAHAAAMDAQGKAFASTVYGLHTTTIKDAASMRSFELKPVVALVNGFTGSVREALLGGFQNMRSLDDAFAQAIYQTTRRSFAQNLKAALEARDEWYQDKLKGMRRQYDESLSTQRASAAEALAQQGSHLKAEIERLTQQVEEQARVIERGGGGVGGAGGGAAGNALGGAASCGRPGAAAGAGAAGAAGGVTPLRLQASSTPRPAADARGGGGGDGGGGAPPSPLASVRTGSVAAAGPSPAGVSTGGGGGGGAGADGADADGGASPAGGSGWREQQAAELRAQIAQINGINSLLSMEKAEVAAWRSKWAAESTKTDAVKREAGQVVTKCEDHVRGLQALHHSEISQRDYILQRCKDTIINLERRVLELSDSPAVAHADIAHLLLLHPSDPARAGAAGGAPPAKQRGSGGAGGGGTLSQLNAQHAAGGGGGAAPAPMLVQVPHDYGPEWQQAAALRA